MLSADIKKKIKYIELRTNKLLNGIISGNYSTLIKGSGVDFDQIREYQDGDDVRFIHWNSSAKISKLLIKQYFEEKDRNIIIALDISASSFYQSQKLSKYELMSQIATILTLVGQHHKDNVGILFFDEQVKEFLPANQGPKHFSNIVKKIFSQQNNDRKTNINCALEYLIKNVKKDSMIFFISDFIDNSFEKNLKVLAKRSLFIGIRCLDKNEILLPKCAIIQSRDVESKKQVLLDLRKVNINHVNKGLESRCILQNSVFLRHNIKLLQINSEQDYFKQLIYYFKYLIR